MLNLNDQEEEPVVSDNVPEEGFENTESLDEEELASANRDNEKI